MPWRVGVTVEVVIAEQEIVNDRQDPLSLIGQQPGFSDATEPGTFENAVDVLEKRQPFGHARLVDVQSRAAWAASPSCRITVTNVSRRSIES